MAEFANSSRINKTPIGNVKTANYATQKIQCGTLAERDKKKYVRWVIPTKTRNFTIRFDVDKLFYGRPPMQKSKHNRFSGSTTIV